MAAPPYSNEQARFSDLIPAAYHDDKVVIDNSPQSTLLRTPSTYAPEPLSYGEDGWPTTPGVAHDTYKHVHGGFNDGSDIELNNLTKKEEYSRLEWHNPKSNRRAGAGICGRTTRIIAVVVVVVLIVLGVGLGVGLTRHSASSLDSSMSSSNSSGPILAGSSISAMITSDDNRHVFYQGNQNEILHSQYIVGSNSWLHNNISQLITGLPARNATPFASILASGLADTQSTTASVNQSILLTYVNNNNDLVARSYQPGGHVSDNLFNHSIPVKDGSRMIRMTPLTSQSNFTIEAILVYEAPTEGYKIFHIYYYANLSIALGNAGYNPVWQYVDITSTLFGMQYSFNSGNISFPSDAAIFDCSLVGGFSNPAVDIGYLNMANGSTGLPQLFVGQYEEWTDDIHPSTFEIATDSTITTASSLPGLGASDTALFTWRTGGQGVNTTHTTQPVWINQNQLYNFNPALSVPFPYPRMAWTASNSTNALYVYNQINGTTLVESNFIDGTQWTSEYILPFE